MSQPARFCIHCGTAIPVSDSRFCFSCGLRFPSWKADFVKCVELGGRSSRSEFWWLHLFFVTVFLLASLVDVLVGTFLNILFFFAFMWPSIAVSVRRLHDIGRSGWWYWVGLVPFFGEIVLLVCFASPGNKGSNIYGPNPNQRSQNPQQTPDGETQAAQGPTPDHRLPPR